MGARNSKPKTVQINNPNQSQVSIEVTPHVMQRLENAQGSQRSTANSNNQAVTPRNCQNTEERQALQESTPSTQPMQPMQPMQPTPGSPPTPPDLPPELYEPSTSESFIEDDAEQSQFKQTMEKLDSVWGRPLRWVDHIEPDINKLRAQLIQCYSANPHQSLACSPVTDEFFNLVLGEQFRTILKHKNIQLQPSVQERTLAETGNGDE